MPIFRVEKNADYTVVSNFHLKQRDLSLKAKGLLTVILSLPDDWDFSLSGLCSLCCEKENAIKSAIDELKSFGYISVTKCTPRETKSGRFEYVYSVFEQPQKQETQKQGLEIQGIEKQGVEIQGLEKQPLLNTNILNTDIQSTDVPSTKKSMGGKPPRAERFTPPTVEEVAAYCRERKNEIDPQHFVDYYTANGWMQSRGKPIKNWEATVRTWEKYGARVEPRATRSTSRAADDEFVVHY